MCIVTLHPCLAQGDTVIASNKFGKYPVPDDFLNQSDVAKEIAKKLAQETPMTEVAKKPAVAEQAKVYQKTKEMAKKLAQETPMTKVAKKPVVAKQTKVKQKNKKEAAAEEAPAAKQATAVHATSAKAAAPVWV